MTWSRLDRRDRAAAAPPQRLGAFLIALASWLLLGLSTPPAHGQGGGRLPARFYSDSSEAAEALLRNAANHAQAGEWTEAVAIYQRIIEQYGEKVARLPDEAADAAAAPARPRRNEEFTLYVDLRAYCQRILASLPPEALAAYRTRRDPQAEGWFQEGKAKRDPAPLRRIIDEAFCSSWGDDALELLGDLAFQDGRTEEALAMYRRLVPDDPANPPTLMHPDPSVDLTRIEAKKILARAATGRTREAAAEAVAFAGRHPADAGAIAGRKGVLAELTAEAVKSDALAPPSAGDARWPTFGGSSTRDRILEETIDAGSIQWRASLERIAPGRTGYIGPRAFNQAATMPAERLLGYHPIVLGDQVLVSDGRRIQAFNLGTRPDESGGEGGPIASIEPAWTYAADGGGDAGPQARQPFWTAPRHTLTAVGRRVYARMGPVANSLTFLPRMRNNAMMLNEARGEDDGGGSTILALDLDRPGDKKVWSRKSSELTLPDRPGEQGSRTVAFEGTPVADARHVYVAVTDRREQTATYVACYGADDGTLRWIRYLGAASSDNDVIVIGMAGAAATDPGSRLLSLQGPSLYYQTNLGAVAALDAETGAVHWLSTYPRTENQRGASNGERDLNPAVVHDGTVFAAPGDASAIFAFDAQTGRLKWRSEPIADSVKVSHLLGVADGRLVATGDRVLLFDVRDGRLLHAWPDAGSREGYGRGLLAGGRIYWPTRTEIQILDQTTGTLAAPPIRLAETFQTTGGNLAAGDGYLIVAQNDGLVAFCQNSRLIERYREEIARQGDLAPPHYRLARAAEAAGEVELALTSYEQAAKLARPADAVDGEPMADVARDHEFRLLLKLAIDDRREGKPAGALARLEAASTVARGRPDRLRARLAVADVLMDLDRPAEAVAALQGILGDERLATLAVPADDGRRAVRADLFVAERLTAIIREKGRNAYADQDRRARALFEEGRLARDPRRLAEAARAFPAAEIVPDALLALGAAFEAENRPAEAVAAYKRLLALVPDDDEAHARALWRLARTYESQGAPGPARDALLRLQTAPPGIRIDVDGGRSQAAADLASAELAGETYASLAADRERPTAPSPLARRWRWRGGEGVDAPRPLTAAGAPPSADAPRTFLADADSIAALDPDDGGERWTAPIGGRALWIGHLADKLVVATPTRALGLDGRTGAVLWRFGPPTEPGGRPGLDPFAPEKPGAAPEEAPAGGAVEAARMAPAPPAGVRELHGFQAVGGHLFVLRGDDELLAVDGDSGLVDWSFSSRGGLSPMLWVGPRRLIVQTAAPNEIVVMETETGRPVSRRPLNDRESLQRPPAPLDDDHAVVVTDRRTLKKLDLTTGRFDWEYRDRLDLPANGAPRAIADAERLLVIHDGRTLIRLDPATGRRRWTVPLGVEDLGERPDASAMDDRRFYWAGGRRLRALSLEDGAIAWSRPLTGPPLARWSIALSDRSVIAYPEAPGLVDETAEPLPVVVHRQADGAIVQRLMLPTPIESVALRLDARGAVVATPHALWALGDRPPPASP